MVENDISFFLQTNIIKLKQKENARKANSWEEVENEGLINDDRQNLHFFRFK